MGDNKDRKEKEIKRLEKLAVKFDWLTTTYRGAPKIYAEGAESLRNQVKKLKKGIKK